MNLAGSEAWRAAYPGACVGVLAMEGVANPRESPGLERNKRALEAELRSMYGSANRGGLRSHPAIAPYAAYYKRFDKTYHVFHQLESVVFKGKSIPRVAALVEAMFMAELKNLLLTAGHDLGSVQGGLWLDVAGEERTYILLNGREQPLKPGDMFIHDEVGILSSILYGPDQRTRITPSTTRALFTVYAPAGVGEPRVRAHLEEIADYARVVAPTATVESLQIVSAGDPAPPTLRV